MPSRPKKVALDDPPDRRETDAGSGKLDCRVKSLEGDIEMVAIGRDDVGIRVTRIFFLRGGKTDTRRGAL